MGLDPVVRNRPIGETGVFQPERRAMRSQLPLAIVLLALMARPCSARGRTTRCLRMPFIFIRTPMQSWGPGSGIYLGKGLFITAAHVVGRAWMTRPKVVIAGQEYPTSTVKEGSFEGTDLTILSIDENLLPMRLRLRRSSLCKDPPKPGQQVVTVVPEGIARSHIIPPDRIPAGVRKFNTAIADVAGTGNSGSGVFDAQRKCLLGIMSRKISQSRTRPDTGKTRDYDIAKYFVPASEIAGFLPADRTAELDQ